MITIDLRQNVIDYINTKADSRFLRLVNALAKTYEEEERDTIEQYTKDINDGIEEIERGEFYTQEEAKKIASQW